MGKLESLESQKAWKARGCDKAILITLQLILSSINKIFGVGFKWYSPAMYNYNINIDIPLIIYLIDLF